MTLKTLLAHNYYQQSGGEDTVFAAEASLLRQKGHTVIEYIDDNHRIPGMKKLDVAIQTVWSQDSYRKISELIAMEKPDLAHFHNTFPLISPSAYYACRRAGVPVVQSLHNPRLICPAASFYRDGKNCTDCLGKTPPYPGIFHGCYRQSKAQTSVVAAMLSIHRILGTWSKMVDQYIVASRFYYDMFIRAGLPEEKIVYKPHFVEPLIAFNADRKPGNYALFVGRLDPEKGVRTLLKAWEKVRIPLKIRGSGQMENEVRQFIDQNPAGNIELIGRLSKNDLSHLIAGARFLVWPTESYYETFGFVAVESFALGVPVIGSRIGVNAEIVKDGVTGMQFTAGDPDDLAAKVQWAWEHPKEMAEMGRNARREYEAKYTADKNYDMLMNIYQRAIEVNQACTY